MLLHHISITLEIENLLQVWLVLVKPIVYLIMDKCSDIIVGIYGFMFELWITIIKVRRVEVVNDCPFVDDHHGEVILMQIEDANIMGTRSEGREF